MGCSSCGGSQGMQAGVATTSGDLADGRYVVVSPDGEVRSVSTYREADEARRESGGSLRAAPK